jgi:DNA-binding response OmpR family regulator
MYFENEGFSVFISNDGITAVEDFKNISPDIVVLDIMMPGADGWQVCREIRKISQTPVIMLSAKGEVFDKVLALELGADDYMVKPFDSKELVARVKAVLRRTAKNDEQSHEEVVFPNLLVNKTTYTVKVNGNEVAMPPKELELLYFLAASPNHVFTREQLLDQIWGYEYVGDTRTVDVHIKRLREKIKDHANWKISTIWGIGYKFEVR